MCCFIQKAKLLSLCFYSLLPSWKACCILSDRRPPGQGASEQEPQNWGHSLCETPRVLPCQCPKTTEKYNSETLAGKRVEQECSWKLLTCLIWAWRFFRPKERMTNQSLSDRKRLLRGICQCWVMEKKVVMIYKESLQRLNLLFSEDVMKWYHKVCGCLGVLMSEVNRVNAESLLELIFILYPETERRLNQMIRHSASYSFLSFLNLRTRWLTRKLCSQNEPSSTWKG